MLPWHTIKLKKKIIISAIDLYIIDKVREFRVIPISTISQETLSLGIARRKNFIEEIENLNNNVYSIRELNLISNYLNIRLSDLFPIDNLADDLLELEVELIPISATIVQIDKYGEVIKNYRILNGRIIVDNKVNVINKI